MSRYEFLAEHAIFMPHNFPDSLQDDVIEKVVKNEREYSFLKKAILKTKAQILTTGLWIKVFNNTYKNQIELIKDGGRKANTGYPELLNKNVSFYFKSFLPVPDKNILLPLPEESFLLQIELNLLSPFYSRDDLAFYPHENPLRREWVFHWPYLSAAGVKGLLRWAWRMCHEDDLLEDDLLELEERLFGPPRKEEKDEDKRQQGCVYTYPIFWEGKVGLDVINPHSRENNTGKIPIKYEVVKQGANGTLNLLVFNRAMEPDFLEKTVEPLLQAIDFLLNDTAISAKRTAGWGVVKIQSAKAYVRGNFVQENKPVRQQLDDKEKQKAELWNKVVKDGELLPLSDPVYTKKVLAGLSGLSEKKVNKMRDKAYERIKQNWEEYKQKLAEEKKEPEVTIDRVMEVKLGEDIKQWKDKIMAIYQKSVMEK